MTDRFAVLMSMGLPETRQRALVHALADAGETHILSGLLLRLQRAPADRVWPDLLRDLRDAFLDLAQLRLAAAAQKRLTMVMDGHPAERAAQDELETSWRHQEDLESRSGSDRPIRRVVRRSGFASSRLQRERRFRRATEASAKSAPAPAPG